MKSKASWQSSMKHERMLLTAACLIMMITSLLFISREIQAQQNSASVSAVVLPNEYNTRVKQKNILDSLSLYQKITFGSAGMLVMVGGIAAYLFIASRSKSRA